MKIEEIIRKSINRTLLDLNFIDEKVLEIELVRTKSREHGDIATNIALKLRSILMLRHPIKLSLPFASASNSVFA